IRKAFAKASDVKPALFSPNSEGACPTCKGAGVVYMELGIMETVATPCEACEGRRFQADVLEYTLGGRNITEVLEMPVSEALPVSGRGDCRARAANQRRYRFHGVERGYHTLRHPLTTRSGGQRQRLRIPPEMVQVRGVKALAQPTSGLHLADVASLLQMLDR